MSSIATDQGSLHYEVCGKGRPVILLHGYQGSWGLWQATMEVLGRSFRTYAVDFWGFGESGARRNSYALEDFVALVDQFMVQLGIPRSPLVGHSMGGTVCLLFAARHPDRVEKLAVISAPIVGSSLRLFPRVFGYRSLGWITHRNLWLYRRFFRLLASQYSKHPAWADMMDRDVSRTTLEAFFASIGSLRRTDLRPALPHVSAPVLAVYGTRDNVVDPDQWRLLQYGLPHVQTVLFPSTGHFPMLDEQDQFLYHLRPFLEGSGTAGSRPATN